MGMFDYVSQVPEVACRKCGALVDGWQSKDGPCTLDQIPFWEVREFYTHCGKCGTWHEFRLKEPYEIRPFSDYELIKENKDG